MSSLPTIGGVVTRGEVFTKLIDHLRECQDLCAVMAHLHNTEDSHMDKTLAHGWLAISEHLKLMQRQVTQMAMNKLQ